MKLRKKMTTLLSAVLLLMPTGIWAGAAISDTGYTDVSAEAWYADSVRYCREQGVMTGISADAFAPEGATSRAMLVSILHRNAGSPDSSGNIRFSDTASGAWYADALRWAVGNNVVSGYSDGRFGPNDLVTREQLASILWRAEGSPSHGTVQPFADQSAISGYARDAVAWAQENGIVSGADGRFQPRGTATRAQTASILYRYLSRQAPAAPSQPETPSRGETAVTITVGNTVLQAVLNDSTAARSLIARLPLTVSMTRGSSDYYSALREPLEFDDSEVHNGWHNGDIGFDGIYLTIFHSGEETSEDHDHQITLGRIADLSQLAGLGGSIEATFSLAQNNPAAPDTPEKRTLIVYFSYTQRTEAVAELLRSKTGGDLFALIPSEPYPSSSSAASTRAAEELASGNLPELTGELPDLTQYDTVLIGSPVWSGTLAPPLYAYLAQADFTGKTVAPFWTDQGTPGSYEEDFTEAVQGSARLTEFLQLTNTTSISAADMDALLDAWLTGFES